MAIITRIDLASTFLQVFVHFVFAVKGRENVLTKEIRPDLHRYITSIAHNRNHKMLAINSEQDHMHIFLGLSPTQSLADCMRDIKSISSTCVTKKRSGNRKFEWQDGYAAFSHSKSQCPAVIRYINNQEKHHAKKSFREEYLEMLSKAGVAFEGEFVFDDE